MAPVLLALLVALAALLGGCETPISDEGDPGPPARLPSGPPHDLLVGFSDTAPLVGLVSPERDAELAARAGAEMARVTIDWRAVEPERDRFDFSAYDEFHDALTRRGIRVLWVVGFAPSWAWGDGVSCSGDCRVPPGEEFDGDWEELVAEVARRYPDAVGIELWNEPNFAGFWHPEPDAERFTELLRKGYEAAKRVRPRLPVVHGGLANFFDDTGDMVPFEGFLEEMYGHGAARYTDAVAVHPYWGNRVAPNLLRSVAAVIRARNRNGDRRTPVWITELGLTTTGTDPDLRWSEEEQAREVAAALARLARTPRVELVALHTLVESSDDENNPLTGYGFVRPDLSPKPAYCRLARILGGRGCGGGA